MRGMGKTLGVIFGFAAGIIVIMLIASALGSAFGSTETREMRSGTLVGLEIAGAALGLILGGIYHYLADWDLWCDGISPLSAAVEDVKDIFDSRNREIEKAKYECVRDRLYYEKGKSAEGAPYREFYVKTLKSFAFEAEDAATKAIDSMKTFAELNEYCLQKNYLNKKAKTVGGLKTVAHFIAHLPLGLVRGIYSLLHFLAPVLLFAGLACSLPLFTIDGVGAYWLLPVFSIIIGAILMIANAISHDWYEF